MKSLPVLPLGSISSGTLRTEDLIPAFISALEDVWNDIATNAPDDFESCQEHVKTSTDITNLLAGIEQRQEEQGEEYWESEDAMEDLMELQDTLSAFAPPYAYFGAHEGDGSDFGCWPCIEQIDDAVREGDLLSVSDTSEVPEDFTGEVWHVNDHGNGTLYNARKGELTEVWSIV